MIFNSVHFVFFFLFVYLGYRLSTHKIQNYLLLFSSYYFYAAWDWRFLSLILFSTIVDYQCGQKIYDSKSRNIRKIFLLTSISTNLGLLGFFKYYNFFAESAEALALKLGVGLSDITLDIILPMGISFYTFQTMSYTIDVYRGQLKPCRSISDFSLYVAFFPQLVAGPIERAGRLLPQIQNKREVTREDIEKGLWLIFFGFFLKIFVADNLAKIVDVGFNNQQPISGDIALVSVYAFSFQIFGDFAGYSSIAIGLSRLMGIQLMTNFRFPYFVTNPADFWKHWHISLSSWLRDYLYIPLGGNRGSNIMIYRNLIITMLLGGLWHGAAWTFVIWGAYQGGILASHRMLKPFLAKFIVVGHMQQNIWWLIRVVFMFQVTCIGWLIFRAESPGQVMDMISSIFSIDSFSIQAIYYFKELVFYTVVLLGIQIIQVRRDDLYAMLYISSAKKVIVFFLMYFLLVTWGEFGGQEFIYFQF